MGTTPWGTVFSAEENFQGSVARLSSGQINLASSFYIGVQEEVKPDGTQLSYIADTTGAEFGQVGEKYGWLVEIHLRNPSFRLKKHIALGRFRHENIAIRAETGNHLVCYMGDDRRGGHLVGVFGNNWMFFIPTFGPFAGVHFPFAIGPTRCEMTGPTFVGNTLVLSVQHPGEDSPTRAALAAHPTFSRTGLEILALEGGRVFPQDRLVPVGSQWPGNIATNPTDIARPAVIGIQRKQPSWREDWERDDD